MPGPSPPVAGSAPGSLVGLKRMGSGCGPEGSRCHDIPVAHPAVVAPARSAQPTDYQEDPVATPTTRMRGLPSKGWGALAALDLHEAIGPGEGEVMPPRVRNAPVVERDEHQPVGRPMPARRLFDALRVPMATDDPLTETLGKFAHFPDDWIQKLVVRLAPEPWGERDTWLEYYCHANFGHALRQERLLHDPEGRFVLWRVGSLETTDGRAIHGYFVRNSRRYGPPYFLVGFVTLDDGILRFQNHDRTVMGIRIATPPTSPKHVIPAYPDLHAMPSVNWQHILETRIDRIRARVPNLPDKALRWLITAAVADAHKSSDRRAVPGWFDGEYQWMLPLHITQENVSAAPDFVAPVRLADDGEGYTIPTLLEPWMAYPLARAIAPDDRGIASWATTIA